ncbi:MAG: hypothetical protein AAF850_11115 [Pseudomonadota bacterium]
MSHSEQSAPAFPVNQTLMIIGYGALLWLLAAFLLRFLGPMGAYNGMGRVATYLLLVPGTVPFLFLGKHLIGFPGEKLALATALMLTPALLLDGAALAWFPGLYGGSDQLVGGAGGTILWGAGVAQALGFLFAKPSSE